MKRNSYDFEDETMDRRMKKLKQKSVERDEFIRHQKKNCIAYINSLSAALETRVR